MNINIILNRKLDGSSCPELTKVNYKTVWDKLRVIIDNLRIKI